MARQLAVHLAVRSRELTRLLARTAIQHVAGELPQLCARLCGERCSQRGSHEVPHISKAKELESALRSQLAQLAARTRLQYGVVVAARFFRRSCLSLHRKDDTHKSRRVHNSLH